MRYLIIGLLFVSQSLFAQTHLLKEADVDVLVQEGQTYKGATVSGIMKWQIRQSNLIIDAETALVDEELANEKKANEELRSQLESMAIAGGVLLLLSTVLAWFVTWVWMRRPKGY